MKKGTARKKPAYLKDLPVQKNEYYEGEITGVTAEGNGVLKIEGFTVFVPGSAVGDKLKIKIVKVLKNYAFGMITEILIPSVDRIGVDCPVFRQCGGCCYRHISYQAELEIKQNQVRDCFERLGGIFAPMEPIAGSERVSGYRNKAQFPLGIDKDGKVVAGFFAKHSHRIVPCTDCKLQPDIFSAILKEALAFINLYGISVYREEDHTGALRHLYLRIAEETGEIMLCLVSAQKRFPYQEELVQEMIKKFPQIVSVILNYNPQKTNVILGEECVTLWGKDFITDILCGIRVQISPLAFYQVNKPQAEALYRQGLAYAELTGKEILLDLYCGTGTIGLSAAKQVKQLIGVEIIPQAIQNAWGNARLNGTSNARFLCGDCKTAVKQLKEENLSPDVILIDPPRKGCDQEVLDTISQLSPQKVVMISCNPATAARDSSLLQKLGYRVLKYRAFDLFPRTGSVECVISFQKEY